MRIVIPGGRGQIGRILQRALAAGGHDVVVLSRAASGADALGWDGRMLGPWERTLDGADAVINLAGRSVNCRYTRANLDAMLRSRVDSTAVIGKAIARATHPPRVWLQMSTATIYAHADADSGTAHDEQTGVIGGNEPGVPGYWARSIEIAKAWEGALAEASTPATRKVALRSAMVMSPDRGGILDMLMALTRFGLGGPAAGGRQYVSWIHERDFVRAVLRLLECDRLAGAINLAAPNPLPQRDFMSALRRASGAPFGLPATRLMLELGAFFLRTDTELLLKSRRVVPRRLLADGFVFEFPEWSAAADDLVHRWRVER